jgi:hypothetical protein
MQQNNNQALVPVEINRFRMTYHYAKSLGIAILILGAILVTLSLYTNGNAVFNWIGQWGRDIHGQLDEKTFIGHLLLAGILGSVIQACWPIALFLHTSGHYEGHQEHDMDASIHHIDIVKQPVNFAFFLYATLDNNFVLGAAIISIMTSMIGFMDWFHPGDIITFTDGSIQFTNISTFFSWSMALVTSFIFAVLTEYFGNTFLLRAPNILEHARDLLRRQQNFYSIVETDAPGSTIQQPSSVGNPVLRKAQRQQQLSKNAARSNATQRAPLDDEDVITSQVKTMPPMTNRQAARVHAANAAQQSMFDDDDN